MREDSIESDTRKMCMVRYGEKNKIGTESLIKGERNESIKETRKFET